MQRLFRCGGGDERWQHGAVFRLQGRSVLLSCTFCTSPNEGTRAYTSGDVEVSKAGLGCTQERMQGFDSVQPSAQEVGS